MLEDAEQNGSEKKIENSLASDRTSKQKRHLPFFDILLGSKLFKLALTAALLILVFITSFIIARQSPTKKQINEEKPTASPALSSQTQVFESVISALKTNDPLPLYDTFAPSIKQIAPYDSFLNGFELTKTNEGEVVSVEVITNPQLKVGNEWGENKWADAQVKIIREKSENLFVVRLTKEEDRWWLFGTTEIDDPTVNWEIYENHSKTYSFKYPSEVFIWQDKPNVVNEKYTSQYMANKIKVVEGKSLSGIDKLGEDYMYLHTAYYYSPNTSSFDYLSATEIGQSPTINERVTIITDIERDGIKGVIYQESSPEWNYFSCEVMWLDNTDFYTLSLTSYSKEHLEKNKYIFDQILSTFKFLDETDTSGWKTYTNEEYGFEIDIPDNWIAEETTDYAKTQDLIYLGDPSNKEIAGDWMEAIISFPDSIESEIPTIGSQFTQRSIEQENISFNGLGVLVVTVTTLEIPDWKDTRLFIEGDKNIYEFNADRNTTVNQILSTFKFID